jgi:hypothetical protein
MGSQPSAFTHPEHSRLVELELWRVLVVGHEGAGSVPAAQRSADLLVALRNTAFQLVFDFKLLFQRQ